MTARPRASESVLIVSCHCHEDLGWLRGQDQYPYVVYSKTDASGAPGVVHLPRNVGVESEAYLTFLVDRYDSLPETLVFIHGHERADHQDGTVLELLASARASAGGDLGRIRYRSLNNHRQCVLHSTGDAAADAATARVLRAADACRNVYVATPGAGRLFLDSQAHRDLLLRRDDDDVAVPALPPYVLSTHSAQFIVHRDLVLSRPRAYWAGLLRKLYALAEQGWDSREIGILFEVLWFNIMTGQRDERAWSGSGACARWDADDLRRNQE